MKPYLRLARSRNSWETDQWSESPVTNPTMLLCEHSTVTRWERDEARRLFQDASKASLTYAKRHGILH
jgi:hypothetical protein